MLSESQIVRDLIGGADADRTRDLLNAIQALSQTELQPHHGEIFQLIGYYPRCQPTSPAVADSLTPPRSVESVKRGHVVRRHQAALVVGDAFEVARYHVE